jgi:hypothetical protein
VLSGMAYFVLQNGMKLNKMTQKVHIFTEEENTVDFFYINLSFLKKSSLRMIRNKIPVSYLFRGMEFYKFFVSLNRRRNSDETVVRSVLFRLPQYNFFCSKLGTLSGSMHRKGVDYRNESYAHNEISWEKKDGKKLGKVYCTVHTVLYTPAQSGNNEYRRRIHECTISVEVSGHNLESSQI